MKKVEIVCTQCGCIFLRLKKQYNQDLKSGTVKFLCSRSCQVKSQITGEEFSCKSCGKSVYRSRSEQRKYNNENYFCSRVCANEINNGFRVGENHPGYKVGKATYRKKALKHYGAFCSVCRYNTIEVLEVHHRDGSRENNAIENLDVLCPTHHVEHERGILIYNRFGNSVTGNTSGSEPEDSRSDS